jgi:hypothetical protein
LQLFLVDASGEVGIDVLEIGTGVAKLGLVFWKWEFVLQDWKSFG